MGRLTYSEWYKGFPGSSADKEFACNAGDTSLIPGSGRSTGEGIGYPLQYSWDSLLAWLVKNPPAIWETWVRSLSWENPLEKGRLPTPAFWPGEFHGVAKRYNWVTFTHNSMQSYLQLFCNRSVLLVILENKRIFLYTNVIPYVKKPWYMNHMHIYIQSCF